MKLAEKAHIINFLLQIYTNESLTFTAFTQKLIPKFKLIVEIKIK
jgi:hypothetical protein